MINPNFVIDAVIDVLKTNAVAIGITDAIELNEDSYSSELSPPYAGVYANFDEDAISKSSDGICFSIPVDISVVFFSSEKKNAAESFEEAFDMIQTAIPIIRKSYSINTGTEEEPVIVTVQVGLKLKPVNILRKSADQSIIEANLQYVDDNL